MIDDYILVNELLLESEGAIKLWKMYFLIY
jgi:hypothetical protein